MQQGEGSTLTAMRYAAQLRQADFNVAQYSGSQKLKAQFKRANDSGARFALIIAENEIANNEVTIKDLLHDKGQTTIAASQLLTLLNEWKK